MKLERIIPYFAVWILARGNLSELRATEIRQMTDSSNSPFHLFRSNSTTVPSEDIRSTTVEEFWWYITSSRKPIYYRDYPGKTGVAIWKEITPSSKSDSKKSKEVDDPSAASISSNAHQHISRDGLLHVGMMLFYLQCFYVM